MMKEKRKEGRDGYMSYISKLVALRGVKRISNIRASMPRLRPKKKAIGMESFLRKETTGLRSRSAFALVLFPL